MSTSTTPLPATQLRGNCQICGRLHAVGNGYVAAHGYTVRNGWFQGACNGGGAGPLQHTRSLCDKVCENIRQDAAGMLARAVKVDAGEIDPPAIVSNIPGVAPTPFREAKELAQKEARREHSWNLRRRAEMGFRVARDMEALADRLFGGELVVVKKEIAPPPIVVGERRQSAGSILASFRVDGARVYWCTEGQEKNFKGWTGSAAWRRMALLPAA